jgi:putative YhdH/YhfP family quinone oxidoreductase
MRPQIYQALVVRVEDNSVSRRVETCAVDDLPPGDVLIRVRYSSLNYKDALSANGNRGVTRHYPHTPGIDAVGEVVASTDPRFAPGAAVVVGGYDLGMNTSGGFGQYIRVPAAWVAPQPPGIDARTVAALGTAGFTAALCLHRLETAGLTLGAGEVLITGATGGVGSIAVALLAKLGYRVVAATGKPDQAPLLHELGAAEVIDRATVSGKTDRALLKQRWAGVVDTVGGSILAGAIKATRIGGLVAACGNAASPDLPLTVYPFILRGVSLLGVDSANTDLGVRVALWRKLAGPWRVEGLERLITVTDLHGLSAYIDHILAGEITGRIVIDLWGRP